MILAFVSYTWHKNMANVPAAAAAAPATTAAANPASQVNARADQTMVVVKSYCRR